MPDRSGVEELRPPRVGQFASAGESNIRIVRACHHHAAKWQDRSRNWRKSANSLWRAARGLDIGRRDQQGCLDGKIGTFCRNMRHEGATEAVRDQNAAGRGLDDSDQAFSPCVAIWPSPIVLMNTPCVSKRLLEASLPMMRSGAVEARDDEDRRHCCQFMQNCRQRTSEWHRARAGVRAQGRHPHRWVGSRYSLLHRRHRTSTCWGR
jgi:hypothetical protein